MHLVTGWERSMTWQTIRNKQVYGEGSQVSVFINGKPVNSLCSWNWFDVTQNDQSFSRSFKDLCVCSNFLKYLSFLVGKEKYFETLRFPSRVQAKLIFSKITDCLNPGDLTLSKQNSTWATACIHVLAANNWRGMLLSHSHMLYMIMKLHAVVFERVKK